MLAELGVYAASYRRTPRAFRPHLAAAVGLWSRGRRQARAWTPHLGNARSLIDTGIDDFAVRRTVAVLGSGPLFDIPLESLARTFERVLLVDRIHLSSIDERLGRYGNITLEWRDLSPEHDPAALEFLSGVGGLDWVISANLLSQLAMLARPGNERLVVDRHLDALSALPCPVTLITDLDYRVFNRHGVMLDSADLLYGRAIPRSGLRWKWEVAPFGEEARNTRRVHHVAAWPDWRLAADL
jgi:hypothetical protein